MLVLLSLVQALALHSAHAQRGPLRGVVWEQPADLDAAEDDLRALHRAGVEAVRTGFVGHERLLTLADTLGLALFQELDLDDLPAPRLADTLAATLQALDPILEQARAHPSARHFGLARGSDTSDPRACAFFARLAERVRQVPGAEAYYLTRFLDDDRCASAVDFVLLDALDAPDPAERLARWHDLHETPAGLGRLGTWVRPGATPGLRDPHAPESQARYLETHLRALLADTSAAAPRALFVYRWRDAPTARPGPAHGAAQLLTHSYGLHTADGTARPALAVVEGLYTGTQTTFAFPAGAPPPRPVPWILLAGWFVYLLLGTTYALSPRFRLMVPRYFQAHAFYRDGVREGREVLLGASIVLLVALALSVGIITTVFAATLQTTAAFRLLFAQLPETAQTMGVALLAQPWMLVLLVGSFYALGAALWGALLSFASRRRHPLIPGQALMLVLWARWPLLVLLAAAMVVPTLAAPWDVRGALLLAGAALLVTLFANARTLYDYANVTYVPGHIVLALGLANPIVLLALAAALLVLNLGAVAPFAWHLITRQ